MDIITIEIYWTVVAFVVFVGIVAWAYSGSRKQRFEQCGQIPFEEDDPVADARRGGSDHG